MTRSLLSVITLVLLISIALFYLYRRDTPYQPNSNGITVYDSSAYDGVNLVWSDHQSCMLMDMDGTVLKYIGGNFCLVTKEGLTLTAQTDVQLRDPENRILWTQKVKNHHWITIDERLDHYFMITRKSVPHHGMQITNEGLLAVDRKGREVFSWDVHSHLDQFRQAVGRLVDPSKVSIRRKEPPSFTHLNSVHVIGKNSSPLPQFREGNIMITCDYYTRIFILDRDTGDIVWFYRVDRTDSGLHSPQARASLRSIPRTARPFGSMYFPPITIPRAGVACSSFPTAIFFFRTQMPMDAPPKSHVQGKSSGNGSIRSRTLD